MKTMKKQMMTLAAVLMAGAAVTSCSSDNEMDSPKAPAAKTYTMTVSATKGGDETRALNLDGNKLNATWATTENVYVKKGDAWANGSLQPQADGASTTLKGTLSGVTFAANDVLTLQFPKSGDITYAGQKGTLADIAENFDWATATATVASVEDGKITVNGNVTFVNQQAIVKFTLKNGDAALSATKLVVNVGGTEYEVNPESAASEIYAAIPGFTGQTVTLTATVSSDTYTYEKTNVTFENGKYYRVTAKMAKQASVPENALSGQFTVGMDGSTPKKVYFSQGNLQYDGTNWKFATNQYDVLGANGTKANGTATGYPMDLFTWGNTSSSTEWGGTSYYTANANLSGTTDWGSRMGTGWYTLSKDEWTYVFGTNSGDKRSGATVGTTANARYTEATINTDGTGVNGVILFPDGATFAADDATWGTINAGSAWGTKCTTAQWTALEAKGCVFLPAAGYRDGTSVYYVGSYGYYWSSTAYGAGRAYDVYFDSGGVYPASDGSRLDGFSVRLVRPVE